MTFIETTEPKNNTDFETKELDSDVKEQKELEMMKESTVASRIRQKMRIPVSYGFVLIMAFFVCFNVCILFLNFERSKVLNNISLTLIKNVLVNAPFWWILSHSHATDFAANRLRQHVVNFS